MNRYLRFALFAASAAVLSGCGILYTNVYAPRAYRTATPGEVKSSPSDETVTGTACVRSVLYLFSWGNSGYAAATKDALKGQENVVLYDVKSDVHAKAFLLGLYTEGCTILTGKKAQL